MKFNRLLIAATSLVLLISIHAWQTSQQAQSLQTQTYKTHGIYQQSQSDENALLVSTSPPNNQQASTQVFSVQAAVDLAVDYQKVY